MITVNNVSLSFGARLLMEQVTININARERIGLVGRNGSGKTTLFNLLTGSLTPDTGHIAVPNQYRIGYLQQHLRFTQPTVREEACLGLGEDNAHEVWQAEKILMGLGFSLEDMDKHPDTFSGGYQVRLNLAKVLIAQPNLLLLDEPTNYLDILSIRWLIGFLLKWPGELLLITHDRSFMDAVTTHTMIIHRQKVRKLSGDTAKLYEQIAQEEEIYENTRLKDEKKRREVEQFINRFRAKARLASMVQSRIKALQKHEKLEKLDHIETLDFAFRHQMFVAKRIMEVKNISFGYDPHRLLINNLTLSIAKQDRIGIIGKNGKGKSTLLRLLNGELTPLNGSLYAHPEAVLGTFGQTNIERLNLYQTVEGELMNADPEHNRKNARDICGAMMFHGDDALKKITVLSGGEKSRVLLGKILLTPINLLLLDEPTNHLDMESCDSLLAAIDNFPGAVIIVTHNEMFLHEIATRLIVFDEQNVRLFNGCYQDFLDQIGWQEESRPTADRQSVAGNRNEQRKKRSAIINERSRILFPIEKKIKAIETDIAKLEKQVNAHNEQIALAAAQGQSQKIQELSVSNHQLTTRIDALFVELDAQLSEHDQYDKRYGEQLEALEE